MSINWYPEINYKLCLNCQKCYQKCPHNVYDFIDNKVIVARGNNCIQGCHGCGNLCPTGAITYVNDQTGWTPPVLNKKIEKENKKMVIKALGGCCKKSTQNYENVCLAVKELGLDVEVEHVSDMNEIMKLGVMATPGLIIDNKVVSVGRMLTVSQAKELIERFGKNGCCCGNC